MEGELERSSRHNALLELNIDEIRQKLKATEKEMFTERQKVGEAYNFFRKQNVMQWDDFPQFLLLCCAKLICKNLIELYFHTW